VADAEAGRAGTPRAAFPRRARVRKRPEFLRIQTHGRRLTTAHYLLFALPAVGDVAGRTARVGVTVSKKVGNAVARNRVKRWVRESCRRLGSALPPGLDLVVVARPSAATAGFAPTARELASLAGKLR